MKITNFVAITIVVLLCMVAWCSTGIAATVEPPKAYAQEKPTYSDGKSYGKKPKKHTTKKTVVVYDIAKAKCTYYSHSCKHGYTYDKNLNKCTKKVVSYEKPTHECKKGYTYDSKYNSCHKSKTVYDKPSLVCKHGYTLNKKSTKCIKLVKEYSAADKTCKDGYRLSKKHANKCVKVVKVSEKPTMKCEKSYSYDSKSNSCIKRETVSVKAKSKCVNYSCAKGYSTDAKSKNKCYKKIDLTTHKKNNAQCKKYLAKIKKYVSAIRKSKNYKKNAGKKQKHYIPKKAAKKTKSYDSQPKKQY